MTEQSPTPTDNPTWERLEDQIDWYDRRGHSAHRWYKSLKSIELTAAAFIPFAAGFKAPAIVIGGLGVVVIVLEGIQTLNQFHENWMSYRSTCEGLKHQKHLYLAEAGPYAESETPLVLLAERIEELISREHSKWVSSRKEVQQRLEVR